MDERTAFGILEISVTKEVDRIKKAYRAVLKTYKSGGVIQKDLECLRMPMRRPVLMQ